MAKLIATVTVPRAHDFNFSSPFYTINTKILYYAYSNILGIIVGPSPLIKIFPNFVCIFA